MTFARSARLLLALIAAAGAGRLRADDGRKTFDLPAGAAIDTLRTAARQGGVEIMFPADTARGVQTRAVAGEFTVPEALGLMLGDTPLCAVWDGAAGAFTIRRRLPSPFEPARAGDVVRLSAFQVSTAQDRGYLAGHEVSATRIDTPIRELPFAISAFTPQFIADLGGHDLYDVVRYAPGVTSGGREFTAGNAVYTIRGFPQAPEHDGLSEGAQGNLYVDSANIERVEVVKGPASLLYGQIAPGGTVNYITKRAQPAPFAAATLAAGTGDYFRADLDVNQPAGSGLLFRLNAAAESGIRDAEPSRSRTTVLAPTATWNAGPNLSLTVNGQWFSRRENPAAQFPPNVQIASPGGIAGALAGPGFPSPASVLQNKVGADAAAGFADGYDAGFLGYYPLPRSFNYSSANDWRDTDLATGGAELDARLGGNWAARGNFNYNSNRDAQALTGIGNVLVAPPGSMAFDPASRAWGASASWLALSPAQQAQAEQDFAAQVLADPRAALAAQPQPAIIPRRARLQEAYGHSATAQVEAAGDFELPWGRLKPAAGLYYDKNYVVNRTRQDAGTAASPFFRSWDVDPASPTYFIDQSTSFAPAALDTLAGNALSFTSDQAAYALLSGSFFRERLRVLAGLRYNRSQSQVTNYAGANTLTSPVFGRGLKAQRLTPQVGLGWEVANGVMAYASYSESYALANPAILATIQNVNGTLLSVPDRPSKPTIGEGYEVGVKTDLWDGRASSTLSIYQIVQEDFVLSLSQVINGLTLSTHEQGLTTRSRGIEYEITWSPSDRWQVYASAAEDDVRNVAVPPGALIYLGTHPQGTTKTLANLWARYDFPRERGRGWWAGGGFNYVGPSAADNKDPFLFVPDYWLWNAVVGRDWSWARTKMSATLHWNNIGNETYYPTNQQRGLPGRAVAAVTGRF